MHPSMPAAYRQFVDDELARAPSLIDRVLFFALNQLRQPRDRLLSSTEQKLFGELAHGLAQHRSRCAQTFVDSLTQLVNEELARRFVDAGGDTVHGDPSRLTLMDDAELAADVELARTIEQIEDVAEWEQRELHSFTSRLSGLDHVAPESNPFRAEVMARALWYAADALPMGRGYQVLFMHVGGEALAQALKLAYAAASTRLEGLGVEPSRYRTGVPPTPNGVADRQAYAAEGRAGTSSSVSVSGASASTPASLADLKPPAGGLELPGLREGATGLHAARAEVDRQVTELLHRMFASVEAEKGLHPELRELMHRLKGATLKMALRDPDMLDDVDHPAWHLLDRLAYQSSCRPNVHDPRLTAYVSFASGIVDGVLAVDEQNAELYRRCVERLDAFAQRQFREQLDEAASEIARLEDAERAGLAQEPGAAPADSGPDSSGAEPGFGAMDVPHMDTVPASLVDLGSSGGASMPAESWVDQQQPGRWYRAYINGRWLLLQLLWRSEGRTQWLFAGESVDHRHALTRRALAKMRADGLIQPFSERRQMRRAADDVLQSMVDGSPPA